MSQNILIIGGVALGPKAACRCKRVDPSANVTLIDENVFISYGGCGIPFYLSGEINNIEDLRSTPYHTVRDAEFFKELKGVNVRTQTRALSIDRAAKTVLVQDVVSGAEETLPYDKLVLATGASARKLPVEGHDLQNIFAVTRLEAAHAIRTACEKGTVSQAVIVGGGFIGLECAVSLADMWGVEVSVVEMAKTLLPASVSPTLGAMVSKDCEKNGVSVYCDEEVIRFEGENGKVCRVHTNKRILDAQLVIVSAGFIPNGSLAKDAGLDVSQNGAIIVNNHMQTSDLDIYAGGDAVAVPNLITETLGYIPLGSMANRQGRVIGSNVVGGRAQFKGYVGSWGVKLFELSFCGVGLTEEQARRAGFDPLAVNVEQMDRAHFYPETNMMSLELVVDKTSRRVLGMQGACASADALKARVDAVAAALQMGQPLVEDVSNLEILYTPPMASAMDIVNVVANVAENALDGRFEPLTPQDFTELWENREESNGENNVYFMDARPKVAGLAMEKMDARWHSMPLEEVQARIQDIPKDSTLVLTCNTGLRAYDVNLILRNAGFTDIKNSMGGLQAAGKQGFDPTSEK